MSQQLRIVAVALGAVAICWLLWKAIDFDREPVAQAPASAGHHEPGAIESDSTTHTGTAPLAADERESLASFTAPPTNAAEVVEPPPGPSLRLFGSLTGERSQELIPEASLRLVDSGWDERAASSDRSGEYSFEGLQAGTWELSIDAPGYRTYRRSIELTPDEPERRLDLVLAPGEIVKVKILGTQSLDARTMSWRGRMDLGEESWRIEPVVTLSEPAAWLPSDGDARGTDVGKFVERTRFRNIVMNGKRVLEEIEVDSLKHRVRLPDGSQVDDLPPAYCGVFVLSKPLPVFASLVLGDLALQTRAVPPGADEVSFEFTREDVDKLAAEVRLRVVDGDTDSPPGQVNILLGQRLAGRRGTRRESDGTVVFQEVLPGDRLLSISSDERETVTEMVVIQPGQVTDLGLYRLRPFSLVRAKVVDDEGEPAQIAFNVFPFERYAATREILAKRIFRSSYEGDLKIDSVGRGRYLILANEEGWVSMPVLADTTLVDQEDLEIHVSKGTPVALRLRADPLPGARLEIRTRSGLPVAERKCPNRDPMKFVLVPGTYSVELWDGETWLASETLTVGMEPVRLYFPR